MKHRLFVFLTFAICHHNFGQPNNTTVYNWKYVYEFTKKGLTSGTTAIIAQISEKYRGETQQEELIRFYQESYDFKIVDKSILSQLIDSLSQFGLSSDIKERALLARNSVMQRLLGKVIRDFNFPNKNDDSIKLSSLNDKIVIVELWTTWCSPCIKEMVNIPAFRKANPSIEFYSISLDKTSDKMKRFVAKNKYDWPIVFGGDANSNQELHEYLNIVAIPKYYTIDRNGVVIDVADKIDQKFINSLK